MTALYELTGEYARLLAAESETLNSETGELTNEFGDALTKLGDAIEVKAENCACVLAQLKAHAEMLKAEEERLRTRRKAIEANTERLRNYVRDCMVTAGVPKLKTPRFTIYTQAGKPKVKITDREALDGKYLVVTMAEDKQAIMADLKAGTFVGEGAEIEVGEESLVIR